MHKGVKTVLTRTASGVRSSWSGNQRGNCSGSRGAADGAVRALLARRKPRQYPAEESKPLGGEG